MMFSIEMSVHIEGFKPFSPSEVEWSESTKDFISTASVTLPNKVWYKDKFTTSDAVLNEGLKITIYAGYNGTLTERFSGFIARVDGSIPTKLICEGYAYRLRDVRGFTKQSRSVNVKEMLLSLISGTDIVLSETNPEINLKVVQLLNKTGWQVLEYLEDQNFSVFFKGNVLYVDLQEKVIGKEVVFTLGENTKKDKGLKFKEAKPVDVNVNLNSGVVDSEITTTVVSSSGTVEITTLLDNEKNRSILAEEQERLIITGGYEGSITGFLLPHTSPGDRAIIKDNLNEQRNGTYFVRGVSGKISKTVCEQKISLGYGL